MKRVHVLITGRVQGVGYRYFAQEKAVALGLTGWVRNLSNGGVEVEAEGPEQELKALLTFLKRGPALASVTHVDDDWHPADRHFKSFEIR